MMEFLLDLLPLGEVALKAHEDRFVRSPLGMFFLRADGRTAVRLGPEEAAAFQFKAAMELGQLEQERGRVTIGRRVRWFFLSCLLVLPILTIMGFGSAWSLVIFAILSGPLLYAVIRFWLAVRRLGQDVEAALGARTSIDVLAISRFIHRNPFRAALPWVVMIALAVPIGLRVPGWTGAVDDYDPRYYSTIFAADIIATLVVFLVALLAVYHDRHMRQKGRA